MEDSEKINNLGFRQSFSFYVFSGEQGRIDATIWLLNFHQRLPLNWFTAGKNLKEVARLTKANALPDFEDPLAACDAWKLQYTARKEAEKQQR